MAFVIADRIMETTATAGTGPLALGGAVTTDGGFVTFGSKMSVADTCEYCIKDSSTTAWEVGLGTYSATNTLTRTTVYASSNANAAVVLAGNATTVVFVTLPASRAAGFAPLASPTFSGTTTVNGILAGTAVVAVHASPGPIGNTAASTGAFTTLTASTPVALASGGTNATTAALARVQLGLVAASASLQWTGGAIVANGTYYFSVSAPYAGTIASFDYFTGNGSFVMSINIAGVSVNGAGTVTVSSATSTNTLGTSLNTFTLGQVISIVITSSTSSPTNAVVNLRLTKA